MDIELLVHKEFHVKGAKILCYWNAMNIAGYIISDCFEQALNKSTMVTLLVLKEGCLACWKLNCSWIRDYMLGSNINLTKYV
jgi:hypothetical protein